MRKSDRQALRELPGNVGQRQLARWGLTRQHLVSAPKRYFPYFRSNAFILAPISFFFCFLLTLDLGVQSGKMAVMLPSLGGSWRKACKRSNERARVSAVEPTRV